ncbi:MAG TPA: pseudouridine synthase [Candidatus Sulfotelmatobacter sp.]|jgi:23S rRNA pseudouridine2605 synthase|nr:pseudouridine synthase [Candidatus Sulfotelmatobacter sp.]
MKDTTQRLNKYLANLGICSRRDVKAFLRDNNVTVNGVQVKESGTRIDPAKDDIRIKGSVVKPPKLIYYLINKPKGIITTTDDEYGRKNITSLVPFVGKIYPVGRLDKDTTGLLILTNDGELTNLLIHPKYHVDKTYRLTIEGIPTSAQVHALRNGVLLEDGITAPAIVHILKSTNTISVLDIIIHEGKNRQIRRMCEAVGIRLLELQRIKFGSLILDKLSIGNYRHLTNEEIMKLRKVAELQ